MKTRVLAWDDAAVAEAAALLQSGDVVGFPTETVYGLGADALNPRAVEKIFAAKGRPGDNPLIVHISSVDQLPALISGEPGETALALARAFWPGPLTMIFPKSNAVPQTVTAGLDTVGVRFPSHPCARALIARAGTPVAAPSGNRSGRPSPTTAGHMLLDMDGRIPLILDGGACEVGLESTVLDVSGALPRVLRPGGITEEDIRRVAGGVLIDRCVLHPLGEGETPRSPGTKYRHYAPKGDLTIVRGGADAVADAICARYDRAEADGRKPLILALDSRRARYGERRVLSLGADEREMAHRLFAALREADELGAQALFSEAVDAEGIGLAVMNRLDRAAGFRILDV